MPKLNHKNIVRYYSCWVEAVEPSQATINQAIKYATRKLKQSKLGINKKFRKEES
jgi:hypothetical protein